MHSFKLDRMTKDRANPENYHDGINYFAFAGVLATAPEGYDIPNPEQSIEDGATEMAAKLSPLNSSDL
jgi:dienelactone hydrolase